MGGAHLADTLNIFIFFFFLMCYFEIIIGVQEVEEIIQSPMYPSASFPEWLHLI